MSPLVFLVLAATAQPTLQDFLTSAEKANVDRRISNESVARAAADFRTAWLGILPSLQVTAGYTYNQFPAIVSIPTGVDATGVPQVVTATITPRHQLAASLRFELPLLDISRWARASASAASEDAAQSRDKLNIDMTRRNVVTAYYGYVAALAVLESSQKTLAVSQELLKLAEIRKNVGTAVELDVLRARAEVERSNQTIADSTSLVAVSARSLQTLTFLEPPKVLTLGADDVRPEPGYDDLQKNIAGLPAVQAAESDFRAARRLKIASYTVLVPTVTANFTENFTNATGFIGRSDFYTAGLGLLWRLDGPTFSGMQSLAAQASTQELNAEKANLNARDQIYSDWQRFTAAITKVRAATAQVEAATKAAQIASTRYGLGAATQIDYIQAARDAFFAEVSQIQARTDLAIARASLRISSGRSLD